MSRDICPQFAYPRRKKLPQRDEICQDKWLYELASPVIVRLRQQTETFTHRGILRFMGVRV